MARVLRPFLRLGRGDASSISQVGLRYPSAAASLQAVLRAELDDIRDAGTWKAERVITTSQGATIRVEERGDAVLNFCANNYLGLSVSHGSAKSRKWEGLIVGLPYHPLSLTQR